MNFRSRPAIFGAVGAVLILVLWYFFLWTPRSNDVNREKKRADQAETQRDELRTRIARLRALKRDEPLKRSQLESLRSAIPDDPALAQFLLQANDAANRSGIDFLSISPTAPSAGAGATSTPAAAGAPPSIKLTITASGGYFQVLDYMNLLDRLPRLVVIDSIQLGGPSGAAPAAGAAAGSAGSLSVNITARMFVSAAAAAAGTPTPPGAGTPGATTTTAPGATTTTAAGATTTTTAGR